MYSWDTARCAATRWASHRPCYRGPQNSTMPLQRLSHWGCVKRGKDRERTEGQTQTHPSLEEEMCEHDRRAGSASQEVGAWGSGGGAALAGGLGSAASAEEGGAGRGSEQSGQGHRTTIDLVYRRLVCGITNIHLTRPSSRQRSHRTVTLPRPPATPCGAPRPPPGGS